MKHVFFYEEFTNKRKRISAGTVVAVLVGNGFRYEEDRRVYDAIAAPVAVPNCPPASTGCSTEHLRRNCRRISEQRAREIHPELFKMLDEDPSS